VVVVVVVVVEGKEDFFKTQELIVP